MGGVRAYPCSNVLDLLPIAIVQIRLQNLDRDRACRTTWHRFDMIGLPSDSQRLSGVVVGRVDTWARLSIEDEALNSGAATSLLRRLDERATNLSSVGPVNP
jgi:hypothetical protein